jgi:hypothetical protein
MPLNHHPVLVRDHPQHLAGRPFVVTGYDLDDITFFHV